MPWKFDGESIVVQDGNPVWINDAGAAAPFNAEKTLKNLNSVTVESLSRKEKIREYETKLKPFEGIEDPETFLSEAQEAIEMKKNLKDKDILDAGQVQAIKEGVAESYKSTIDSMKESHSTEIDKLQSSLDQKNQAVRNLLIKGAFTASKFIKEKTALAPSIAFSEFGRFFDVEDNNGELVAVATRGGKKIFSNINHGDTASTEEAIEILVNEHPDRDSILRANPSGSGSQPNHSSSITDMLKLSPAERLNAARRQ